MAYNFDSGQFNKETKPIRLGNWQIPRWSPTRARPLEMRPDPKPVCDLNGRFLPGAPRGSSKCFGHYTGTWDLPRKITRAVAEELQKEPPDGRFSDWLNLRVQRPKAATSRTRDGRRGKGISEQPETKDGDTFQDEKQEVSENFFEDENTKIVDTPVPEAPDDDPLELNEKLDVANNNGEVPYIPGSQTDEDKRHDSYDILIQDAIEQTHGPQEDKEEKFLRKVAEKAEENVIENMKHDKKSTLKLPCVNVTQNFNFAKKMHSTNLEHEPLPDTLGYRNLTKVGEHRDSDIIVKPYAIGWKGYGASGPTCCTKLRVHRPKTCDPKKTEETMDQNKRPSTSLLDLGRHYQKSLSLMDLAICWDFKAADSKQEPKPPKHIDGSNGSKAPAVFTMVYTPKEETEEHVGHAQPIFNQNKLADTGRHSVPYFEKDMTKEKKKDSCDVQYCPQHNKIDSAKSSSSRKSSVNSRKKECDGVNGCGTLSDISRDSSRNTNLNKTNAKRVENDDGNKNKNSNSSIESYDKTPLAQGKLRQSSPNESQISRNSVKNSDSSNNNGKHRQCLSCNMEKTEPKIQKEEYKFALKAGNPNSIQSNSSNDCKGLKIPKMRHPYTKKSYTIPTLAPPFSIWRDANATGYPEHWRLASVYQHAYKPPDQRRKPLIASVYQ